MRTEEIWDMLFKTLAIGLSGIFLLLVIGGCEKEKSVTGPTAFNASETSINNAAVANKSTCTEAKGYTATQCGSVRSDVGTPPYPCCDNNDNKKVTDSNDGNCTWYVWYKAKEKGWNVPSSWGNAGSWCTKAELSGWWVSDTPKENTIACGISINHVAWVYRVSTDKKTIYVEEMNCRVPPSCYSSGLQTKSHNASKFRYISAPQYLGEPKPYAVIKN